MEDKFRIQEIPGKGLGLVSTTFIPKGTRILSESPMFKYEKPSSSSDSDTFERMIDEEVTKLSSSEREFFFHLSNSFGTGHSQMVGIVKSNALLLKSSKRHPDFGIFRKASRVNHSCDPNSYSAWNEETNQLTIQNFKDVEEGSEITITYLDGNKYYISYGPEENQNSSSRRSRLKIEFNFTCTCTFCSMSPVSRQESDNRLNEIFRLDMSIHSGVRVLNLPLPCIKEAYKMFLMLRDEGISDARLARFFYSAFQILIAHGDQARAKVFLEKAYSIWVTLQGSDHPRTRHLGTLVNNPKEECLFSGSNKWESIIDDVPRSLTERQLDAWLWTYAKRMALPDFRRDTMWFPTERDLHLSPWDGQPIPCFFQINGHTPVKHWCFFAEVIKIRRANRRVPDPMLTVVDKSANERPLYIHAERLLAMGAREGRTIAIMYAESRSGHPRGFPSDVKSYEGEAGMLKVFTFSLMELLQLNDRVRDFSGRQNGQRTCHGCDRKSDSLRRCPNCPFFWYCNHDCRRRGLHKGHKRDCERLQDPDLLAMYRLEWGTFNDYFRFS